MTIRTREDVLAALNSFERRPSEMPALADRFVTLLVNVYANADTGEHASLERALSRVNGEHSNLLSILERSEWQKQRARAGDLNHTSWMFFSGLDIEHFYIALRSFFDQLAGVCRAAALKRDQVPRSFRALLNLCETKSQKAVEILGKDLVDFIVSCDWFRETRATRDGIVHYGALTLTSPNFDTIAFHVSAGERSSNVMSELKLGSSLADFELFMAWALGNITLMLDHLAGLLLARFANLSSVVVRSARPSYSVLCAYLERLSDVMPSAGDATAPDGA